MKPENIFNNIPTHLPDELLQTLLQKDSLHIERIVSNGHNTPTGEWYGQDLDEWVLVVQGRARLELDEQRMIELKTGDYILLPAHQRHRVDWTDPDIETIWLAIHFPIN